MNIRKFNKTDLFDVKVLVDKTIDKCYSDVYCAEAVKFFKDWHSEEKILQNAEDGYTIVLEINSRIAGTGTIVADDISRVFVDPEFQKHGFGKLIMQKLEGQALATGNKLVNLDASLPSKNFYDSLGYITLEKTFIELENKKRLDYYKMQKLFV